MGGTNPRVVRELIALGAEVRHADDLHAKLYLFDDAAALGSSNASANGLSRQGNEVEGWIEANVVSEEPAFVRSAASSFRRMWAAAREVTEDDLARAKAAWDRRRRAEARAVPIAAATLLDALRTVPETLRDRSIYLEINFADMSEACLVALEDERQANGAGDELGGYEEWPDMPDGATFVSFHRGPRGGLKFYGYWHAPERRRTRQSSEGTAVNFVERVADIERITEVGSNTEWRPIIDRVVADEGDGEIVCIELGELARRYLVGGRGDA